MLDNETRFLNNMRDPNGEVIGPAILDAFLETGSALIIGIPGAGKTTVQQVMRKTAQPRLNPEDVVHGLAFDMVIDLVADKLKKRPSEWNTEDGVIFSQHLTDLIRRMTGSCQVTYDHTFSSEAERLHRARNELVIADLIGVSSTINLGRSTLEYFATDPKMVFVHAIPHPKVLDLASEVRDAFYPLGTSKGSRKKMVEICADLKKREPEVREFLMIQGAAVLNRHNIVTDIEDPNLLAELIAKMGSPAIVQHFRTDIRNQAERLEAEGKVKLPDKSTIVADQVTYEIGVHVAHSNYYLPYELHLPPERTYRVVNHPQTDGPIPWNLGGLYDSF